MSNSSNLWYNPRKLLSYNKMLNFVMSHRGGGKTYASKRLAIKNFLKDGSEFVYLRRYKTELKGDNVSKFFDDVSQEFPGHEFEVKGHTFYIDKKKCGYARALTQQVQIRSTPFPKVTLIIFDEFILDDRGINLKYLPDEVKTFLEVLSTIIRSRDNVRVLCCANSISYVNPYFDFWKIRINPSNKKSFYFSPLNDQVILELYQNKEFKTMMEKTRFGRLISGTPYGDYAISNEVLLDTDEFLLYDKPSDSEYVCSFKYDDNQFGCWYSPNMGIYHFNDQIDPYHKIKISVTTEDHAIDYKTIKSLKNNAIIITLKQYYSYGKCFYKDQETKRAFFDIFKIIGV